MLVSGFDFQLPEELVAQRPLAERGGSRMLQLDRRSGAWQDRMFRELPRLLDPGDLLVLNDTRVLPARLFGRRVQAGVLASGLVEVLLTERVAGSLAEGMVWRALVKPAKKARVGVELVFGGSAERPEPLLRAEVVGAGDFGERVLRFFVLPDGFVGERGVFPAEEFYAVLERIGHLPLPPYIRRVKGKADSEEDRERYQTVYSSGEQRSAAAPTAGLHFTEEVLGALKRRGVEVARVTLHVGLGTFQPVRVERTEEVRLHAEPYTLGAEAAEAINVAWREGRRIVAVGTTTTRTLEHVARIFEARFGALGPGNPLRLEAHSGSTGLFLSPGPDGDDRFLLVGGLLTNFHLPQSTLLMLVSAFAGQERVLAAYRHAVEAGYRFFSYGDCMLVV